MDKCCNAAEWDGKAMPRPPSRSGSCSIRRPPIQMVHIMEGVIERGTATVLRDLDRPMFGKTGTTSARPTSGSSAARRISLPAFTSATTSRGRWAAAPRAAASPRRSSSSSPRSPSRTCRRFRSSRPPESAWSRIDRVTGKRVFGTFPTARIPSPRSSGRHSSPRPSRAVPSAAARWRRRRGAGRRSSQQHAAAPARAEAKAPSCTAGREPVRAAGDFLQRQGGIY